MKSLANLIVSQNDLRHSSRHLRQMIDYVKGGGHFTLAAIHEWATLNGGRPDPPLIAISRFAEITDRGLTDGMEMIHDGHNRAVVKYLAGFPELDDREFFVLDFSLRDYKVLEPQNNWFTPFDPIAEIRKAEFGDYKTKARQVHAESPDRLDQFVNDNRAQYCTTRDLWTVPELAAIVGRRL